MKVKSTLYLGDTPINECTWELDDRARGMQRSLACLQIEDHLYKDLKVDHKIIADELCDECKEESETEDVPESEPDVETSDSSDQPVQSDEDRELNRVDDWADVDEDRS